MSPEEYQGLQQQANQGLGAGLESAVGQYFDTQKQRQTLSGASDILSNLGKDYELEDILSLGQQMNAHPNAVQAALHMGKTAQDMRMQRERFAPKQEKPTPYTASPEGKAAVDLYNSAVKTSPQAEATLTRIRSLRSLGEKDPSGQWPSWIKNIAGGGESAIGRLAQYHESPEAAGYQALTKAFVQDFKQTFGARITDRDLALIESMIPSLGRNKEANEAILRVYESVSKRILKENEIIKDAYKQWGGVTPGFIDDVSQKVDAFRAQNAEEEQQFLLFGEKDDPSEGGRDFVISTPQGKFKVDEAGYKKYQADQAAKQGQAPVKMRYQGKVFSVPADSVEDVKTKFPGSEVLQ
jgi:hypothetical protein